MDFDFCLNSVLLPKERQRPSDLQEGTNGRLGLDDLLGLYEVRDISEGVDSSAVVSGPSLLERSSGDQKKAKIISLKAPYKSLYKIGEKILHYCSFRKMLKQP